MLILALLLQQVTPCADWRGWDADKGHDICGPARTPTRSYPEVEPIARKLGNVQAVHLCGIRDAGWFDMTARRLERGLWNVTLGRAKRTAARPMPTLDASRSNNTTGL
jgi:hypothetical protein